MKLPLCLIKYLARKTCRLVEVQAPSFLISVLDGSVWSASRFSRCNPGEIIPVPIVQEPKWAPESV
jgi:hypothetical protein